MPGMEMRVGGVDMDFNYADYFGTDGSTGYEVLIYDCMIGDQTLFQRATWWRPAGMSSIRSWTCGRLYRREISPTTPPVRGAQGK